METASQHTGEWSTTRRRNGRGASENGVRRAGERGVSCRRKGCELPVNDPQFHGRRHLQESTAVTSRSRTPFAVGRGSFLPVARPSSPGTSSAYETGWSRWQLRLAGNVREFQNLIERAGDQCLSRRASGYCRSTWCTKATAIDPSPTADATRLILPPRTSPTAKMR